MPTTLWDPPSFINERQAVLLSFERIMLSPGDTKRNAAMSTNQIRLCVTSIDIGKEFVSATISAARLLCGRSGSKGSSSPLVVGRMSLRCV
jgi:hypothetical protein